MNTPLNDALKPCPICQKPNAKVCHNTDDSYRSNWFYFVKCKSCGCKGGSDQYKDQAIAAWNTRANTPESSAAQGEIDPLLRAMIDDGIVAQPSDTTAQPSAPDGWKLVPIKLNKEMFDVIRRHDGPGDTPGDTYEKLLAAADKAGITSLPIKFDEPQPRVDLTDEQIEKLSEDFWGYTSDDEVHMTFNAIGFAHALLLVNTAQGKTEQDAAINLALEWDQSRKYIMPYIIRDALRAALAAKKG